MILLYLSLNGKWFCYHFCIVCLTSGVGECMMEWGALYALRGECGNGNQCKDDARTARR
jgi:hypothetical protein